MLAATRDNAGSGTGNNSQFHSSFSFEAIMINASGEKQKIVWQAHSGLVSNAYNSCTTVERN